MSALLFYPEHSYYIQTPLSFRKRCLILPQLFAIGLSKGYILFSMLHTLSSCHSGRRAGIHVFDFCLLLAIPFWLLAV